jgi:hypothetical protein
MTWKPEYTLALIPIGAAIAVSIVLAIFTSAATAQWASIITFLVLLPFVVGRLIDRAR